MVHSTLVPFAPGVTHGLTAPHPMDGHAASEKTHGVTLRAVARDAGAGSWRVAHGDAGESRPLPACGVFSHIPSRRANVGSPPEEPEVDLDTLSAVYRSMTACAVAPLLHTHSNPHERQADRQQGCRTRFRNREDLPARYRGSRRAGPGCHLVQGPAGRQRHGDEVNRRGRPPGAQERRIPRFGRNGEEPEEHGVGRIILHHTPVDGAAEGVTVPAEERKTVLSQSSIFGQNPKFGSQEFNDLQTPKLSKKQLCDRTRRSAPWVQRGTGAPRPKKRPAEAHRWPTSSRWLALRSSELGPTRRGLVSRS